MTSHEPLGRRIVSAIGPYPIRPVVLAGTMAFLSILVTLVPTTEYWWTFNAFERVFVPAVLTGGGTAVWATLGRAWQRRHGVHWGSYLVFVMLMGSTVPLIRTYYEAAPDLPSGSLGPIPPYIRAVVAVLLVNMLIGSTTRRLQAQVDATEEALEVAREQQLQILAADEEARRQIASLLHDRVQAELIAVCLEMRSVAHELPDREHSQIDPLIQRLETLRSLDLRNAARALSPNLDAVDLQTALEELAVPFEASILIVIDVDPMIDERRHELGDSLLLACYRIVEQGLINVASHARASRVDISIWRHGQTVTIRVVDDGIGLSNQPRHGFGWAVITTWVRAVHGQWQYARRAGDPGTELRADLPVVAGGSHL